MSEGGVPAPAIIAEISWVGRTVIPLHQKNGTDPLRSTDRTSAYEADDGSSSLSEGTTEFWQRRSMRRTENPENEVRVLEIPQTR